MYRKTINNWNALPVVLDLQTVALILDHSEPTIKRWLKNGMLKGKKIGHKWLFDKEYIKSLVEINQTNK